MFEMYFYTAMALALLLSLRYATQLVIGFFGVCVLAGTVWPSSYTWWTVFSSPMLLEFVFGALLALVFRRTGRRSTPGAVLLIAGALFICWLQTHWPHGADSQAAILLNQLVPMRVWTWGVAAWLVVAGMVLWSPAIDGRLGTFFVLLGNASYSAYLCSHLVLEFGSRGMFRFIIHQRTAMTPTGTTFCFFSLLTMVMSVGWLSYQFVEWPMVRWLQRQVKRIA